MNTKRTLATLAAMSLPWLSAGGEGPKGFFGDCREVAELNSPGWEVTASITDDGKTLVFSSTRHGGTWHEDLYMAYRDDPAGPFTRIRRIDELSSSDFREIGAYMTPDGLRLYCRDAAGFCCAERDQNTWESRFIRKSHEAFASINVFLADSGAGGGRPWLTRDELVLVFTAGGDDSDLYEARRQAVGEAFGLPRRIAEVDDGAEFAGTISSDGLTLFYGPSFTPHHNTYHLWMTHRVSRDDPPDSGTPMSFSPDWEIPGCPNHWFSNYGPSISPQWPAPGSKLYYSQILGVGENEWDFDIWEATWHPDCNENGVDDREDIASGESEDCNQNSIPDECEEGPVECNSFFRRGDANDDAEVDIADAIYTLDYLFGGAAAPGCLDALDGNDDGAVDTADAITVLGYLFANTGPLKDPFGECGLDPTEDPLHCHAYTSCVR